MARTRDDGIDVLSTALEEFRQALVRRWREHICEAVLDGRDYPTVILAAGSGHQPPDHRHPHAQAHSAAAGSYQPPWDYRHPHAQAHLIGRGQHCDYVAWVNAGQEGALESVACSGTCEDTGGPEPIPASIECGMYQILKPVDVWAWEERRSLFVKMPLFADQDEGALEQAHDDMVRLAKQLGLQPTDDSGATPALTNPTQLPETVNSIRYDESEYSAWWAGWTGLLADTVGKNFFSSVRHTLNNQAIIAGVIANLYASRGRIIATGRNDRLHLIQQATGALGETQMITTPPATGWKVVQGLGLGTAVAAGWSVPGATVAASLQLVGYLGEQLDGRTFEVPSHDFQDVVTRLNEGIDELNTDLEGLENDYFHAAMSLRSGVYSVHSFNLELYDFSGNNPEGRNRDDSLQASISNIVNIAKHCYIAGEDYEQLFPIIPHVSGADRSLADKDGQQTRADQMLIEVRELLQKFLKTTSGRYLVAGEMVEEAGEAYASTDDELRGEFDIMMADWEKGPGVGDVDVGFDYEAYAEETERRTHYPVHPSAPVNEPGYRDPSRPEVDDPRAYAVEEEA